MDPAVRAMTLMVRWPPFDLMAVPRSPSESTPEAGASEGVDAPQVRRASFAVRNCGGLRDCAASVLKNLGDIRLEILAVRELNGH